MPSWRSKAGCWPSDPTRCSPPGRGAEAASARSLELDRPSWLAGPTTVRSPARRQRRRAGHPLDAAGAPGAGGPLPHGRRGDGGYRARGGVAVLPVALAAARASWAAPAAIHAPVAHYADGARGQGRPFFERLRVDRAGRAAQPARSTATTTCSDPSRHESPDSFAARRRSGVDEVWLRSERQTLVAPRPAPAPCSSPSRPSTCPVDGLRRAPRRRRRPGRARCAGRWRRPRRPRRDDPVRHAWLARLVGAIARPVASSRRVVTATALEPHVASTWPRRAGQPHRPSGRGSADEPTAAARASPAAASRAATLDARRAAARGRRGPAIGRRVEPTVERHAARRSSAGEADQLDGKSGTATE